MARSAKRTLGVLIMVLALAGASEPRDGFERDRARAQAEYDALCNPDPQVEAARTVRELEAKHRIAEERARALGLTAPIEQETDLIVKNIVLCTTVP
jgi:hypothetical protein